MVSVLPASSQRLRFRSEVEAGVRRVQDSSSLGRRERAPPGGPAPPLHPIACVLQVLRYFDYVFTGVFTFEMVIKVKASRENLGFRVWMGHLSAPLVQCPSSVLSAPGPWQSPSEASAAPSPGLGLRVRAACRGPV